MPYALRTRDGQIDSLHREPEPGAEYLPPDHPDVLAFLGRGGGGESSQESQPASAFASMDAGLVRVLEDLVDVLIMRNVIRITDLPPEAQQKLFDRKHFRDRMQKNSLRLFEGTDFNADDVIHTDFGKL